MASGITAGLQSSREYQQRYRQEKAAEQERQRAAAERNAWYERSKGDIESAFSGLSESAQSDFAQRKSDVRADAARGQAAAMGGLNRLGMGNTTVAPTLGEGFSRYMNAELNRVEEMSNQQKQQMQLARAGAISNLAGAAMGQAGQYNLSGLEALTSRQNIRSSDYVNTLDPMLRSQGAYIRGTMAAAFPQR